MQNGNARVRMPAVASSLENASEVCVESDAERASHKAAQRTPLAVYRPSTSGTPSYGIPASVRDLAEQSVEQARSAVCAFLASTRQATHSLQASTDDASHPASAAFSHGLELSEQTTAAAFALAQNIVRAENLREVMQLQADFACTQLAVWQTEMAVLTELPPRTKR